MGIYFPSLGSYLGYISSVVSRAIFIFSSYISPWHGLKEVSAPSKKAAYYATLKVRNKCWRVYIFLLVKLQKAVAQKFLDDSKYIESYKWVADAHVRMYKGIVFQLHLYMEHVFFTIVRKTRRLSVSEFGYINGFVFKKKFDFLKSSSV